MSTSIQREMRTIATRIDNLSARTGELVRVWEERAEAFEGVEATKPIATELRRCAQELRAGRVEEDKE